MHVKLVFIYTINIQVSKYRFSKNSFNLILNVANGSFFNGLNYSITQQRAVGLWNSLDNELKKLPLATFKIKLKEFLLNRYPVVVENRGIRSASLFLVARLFSSLRLRNRSHRYVGARLYLYICRS